MHKKKVIDLQNYRDGEAEEASLSDEGEINLRAGTALLFGQYTILGYINCGGFGITYLAQDSLGRKVAVKECFPGELCYRSGKEMRPRSPSFKGELEAIVDHFIKEAQRLAGLKHDNIVHVHQVFEENATAYIVMDYIDGPDLLDIAESDEAHLNPEVVEALTEKMLHAIAYVHGRGILHRDISPDNILVKRTGEPILIDFGAAQKASEKSANLPSRLKFVKDGYSPQEFYIPGREQGPSSDLYSFAASLHHVIAGYPPEDGQKRLAALAAKEPDPYQPLAGRIEGYSPGFLKAIDKALEILPANRIQTAEDWHAMLGGHRPAPILSKRPRALTDRSGLMALPIENFAAAVLERTEKKKPMLMGSALAASVVVAGLIGYWTFGGATEPETTGQPAQPVIAAATPPVGVITPSVAAVDDQPREVAALPPSPSPDPAPVVVEAAPVETPLPPPTAPVDTADESIAQFVPVPVRPIETQSSLDDSTIVATSTIARPEAPVLTQPETSEVALAESTNSAPVIGDLPLLPTVAATPGSAPDLAGAAPEAAVVSLPKLEASLANAPIAFADAPNWSEIAALPKLDRVSAFDLPTQLAPLPNIVLASVAPGKLDPIQSDAVAVDLAPLDQVFPTATIASLPPASGEIMFNSDVTPPAYVPNVGAVLTQQVAFSHWNVKMPFESQVERVRNSNTETITGVAPGADLATSGAWIKDGVIIYSFNGERLLPDTPLSVHALNNLSIDPDGYMRASVRYRDPDTGTIDRGLLAMPVVREIGLADGTRLEARVVALNWVLTVTEAATGNDLRVGDTLAAEVATGATIDSHEALTRALDRLVSEGAETATFTVNRAGAEIEIVWPMARES